MRVNGSFEGIFSYLFHVAHIPLKKSTTRTRVLSISLHDLCHYESVFHILTSHVRLMKDVAQEATTEEVSVEEMVMNPSVRARSIVLVAHMKSTSMLMQDLRYIVMSSTAAYSDVLTHLGETISGPHGTSWTLS